MCIRDRNNGDNGIRTRDLCVANAALSQLSYIPANTFYYNIYGRNIKRKQVEFPHFMPQPGRLLPKGGIAYG